MPLDILCIGAHPDDNEASIGGTAALFCQRGDRVKFVSVTDGSKGHFAPEYIADPGSLAHRRHDEALAAAAVIGAEYECMGLSDGEVYVTPANTEAVVRLIRSFGPPGQGPDLVILNRPNDYHRDHRYTAQLVLDAAYVLTVPPMCPDTRALERMPVFAYYYDDFTEGGAFRADVVAPIDEGFDAKVDMVCAHASQFFEWIPYNAGAHSLFAGMPADAVGRRERMAAIYRADAASQRDRYVDLLRRQTGSDAARLAEAFQISEYGRRPDEEALLRLFPMGRE